MRPTPAHAGSFLGLALLLGFPGGAGPGVRSLRAQEEPERGKEREERCVCFDLRVPPLRGGLWMQGLWRGRGRLGIVLADEADPETDSIGARIEEVLEGSPADEAGLRPGDIITAVNGRRLTEPLDEDEWIPRRASPPARRLRELAREFEPGDTVRIDYRRNGGTGSVLVEAADLSEELYLPEGREAVEERLREAARRLRDAGARLRLPERLEVEELGPGRLRVLRLRGRAGGHGLELVPLNEGLGEYFGTERGVLVTEVDPGSELGLRPGDVILSIGDREVEDPAHVEEILDSYRPHETVRMEVVRKGRRVTVEGRVDGSQGRRGPPGDPHPGRK